MNSYALYLTVFDKSAIINSLRQDIKKNIICLYADFNVINLFYKKNISLDKRIILYPDSTAVVTALFILFRSKIKYSVSTDLQLEILRLANMLKKKVFFFGDKKDILFLLKVNLKMQLPNLAIVGLVDGYNYSTEEVLKKINDAKPDILFVGLGVGRQEPWILENLSKIDIPYIISVGGWFGYLADTRKRAPKALRLLHLEWLYKLLTEFNRVWKRYLVGVPLFFYRVLTKKIIMDLKTYDG